MLLIIGSDHCQNYQVDQRNKKRNNSLHDRQVVREYNVYTEENIASHRERSEKLSYRCVNEISLVQNSPLVAELLVPKHLY